MSTLVKICLFRHWSSSSRLWLQRTISFKILWQFYKLASVSESLQEKILKVDFMVQATQEASNLSKIRYPIQLFSSDLKVHYFADSVIIETDLEKFRPSQATVLPYQTLVLLPLGNLSERKSYTSNLESAIPTSSTPTHSITASFLSHAQNAAQITWG